MINSYSFYKKFSKIIDRYFPWYLDKVDYHSTHWRAAFYRNLETDFNTYNYKKVNGGRLLSEVIKESMGWKTGDLKNGWKSICISGFPIEQTDLKLFIGKDWNGLIIGKKGIEVSVIK